MRNLFSIFSACFQPTAYFLDRTCFYMTMVITIYIDVCLCWETLGFIFQHCRNLFSKFSAQFQPTEHFGQNMFLYNNDYTYIDRYLCALGEGLAYIFQHFRNLFSIFSARFQPIGPLHIVDSIFYSNNYSHI